MVLLDSEKTKVVFYFLKAVKQIQILSRAYLKSDFTGLQKYIEEKRGRFLKRECEDYASTAPKNWITSARYSSLSFDDGQNSDEKLSEYSLNK